MGMPAAVQDDNVIAVDIHIVMFPSPTGEVPVPLPHPFAGKLDTALSTNVQIGGKFAATLTSVATNSPSHVAQGPRFMIPPTNKGIVILGSFTVLINNKPAARMGDMVLTCNDPAPLPVGTIVGPGVPTVLIG